MKTILQHKALPWLIYPFVMVMAVVLFVMFRHNILAATYISLSFSSLFILVMEFYLPYNKSWKPDASDWTNDSIFFVAVQMLLPKALVWLTIHFVIVFINNYNLAINNVWPHHWPIGVQVVMVILISDLLRYWLHRLSHTYEFLWRLHAVHHSVQKLYWLNTSRFHPLEKGLQFLMDVFPFMLLGVSEEVIALHFILYAVNGSFQHCNIVLKYGWLNYVVSSADLHRWHHSRKAKESNNNYGNNIILWDIVFGTFYLPPGREVEEIGLINRNYPMDFVRQMQTPLFNKYDKIDRPDISTWQIFLNFLFAFRMKNIGKKIYTPLLEDTKNCKQIQERLLQRIIEKNKSTSFGKDHFFHDIHSYTDFKRIMPVTEYEQLRPYIKQQEENPQVKSIVNDEIIMFNKTSGTTSEPKYIPVTTEVLRSLQRSQQIQTYIQYQLQPASYSGRLGGVVSPAVEGETKYQIPYGAASGHFYKTMPSIVRSKYALPYEVFEIADYESKYYCILLLLLQYKNLTYFGCANPTTYLKLIELLNKRKVDLLSDLKKKSLTAISIEKESISTAIRKKLKPGKKRIIELEMIFASSEKLTFRDLWPYLNLITAWTGGSCGVALKSVLKLMPENICVIDPGYLSSEVRGSFTFDVHAQSGMLTFQDNFFEFVERGVWENNKHDFKLMTELELNKEYNIFITTQAGLYRYNMNDIVVVSGFLNQAPLIKFVQKGKGVCNITGEKLYESQLLSALDELGLHITFVQVLANVDEYFYECFIESNEHITDIPGLSERLDEILCRLNTEYKEKRGSNRLKQIQIKLLKTGTFETIKSAAIGQGQKEGQYKTVLLQYKNQFKFNLDAFAV